jgi:hypothetical protein
MICRFLNKVGGNHGPNLEYYIYSLKVNYWSFRSKKLMIIFFHKLQLVGILRNYPE